MKRFDPTQKCKFVWSCVKLNIIVWRIHLAFGLKVSFLCQPSDGELLLLSLFFLFLFCLTVIINVHSDFLSPLSCAQKVARTIQNVSPCGRIDPGAWSVSGAIEKSPWSSELCGVYSFSDSLKSTCPRSTVQREDIDIIQRDGALIPLSTFCLSCTSHDLLPITPQTNCIHLTLRREN